MPSDIPSALSFLKQSRKFNHNNGNGKTDNESADDFGYGVTFNLFDILCLISANLTLKTVESVGESADGKSDFESVEHNDKSKNTAGSKNIRIKSVAKTYAAAKRNYGCGV